MWAAIVQACLQLANGIIGFVGARKSEKAANEYQKKQFEIDQWLLSHQPVNFVNPFSDSGVFSGNTLVYIICVFIIMIVVMVVIISKPKPAAV